MAFAAFNLTAIGDETLDEMLWRELGTRVGLVETVLEANPGLAELGPVLPDGTIVVVPSIVTAAPAAPLLQLWD